MDAPDEPDDPRADRRLAARTIEREYDGVDPHRCIRALEDRLGELGYRVESTRWSLEDGTDESETDTSTVTDTETGTDTSTGINTDTETDTSTGIDTESGTKAAAEPTFSVRLTAVSMEDGVSVGSRSIEYRPYGPQAALVMLIGAIFALPTLFVSLALSAIGYYLYRKRRRVEVPVVRREAIDVLLTGEIPEGTRDALERGDPTATDLHVTLTAWPTLAIDTNRLSSLEWPVRPALVNRVGVWRDELLERQVTDRDVDDVFFEHLSMWRTRDPEADRETVTSIQADLHRRHDTQNAYTELLLEESTVDWDLEPDSDSGGEGDVREALEALAAVCASNSHGA